MRSLALELKKTFFNKTDSRNNKKSEMELILKLIYKLSKEVSINPKVKCIKDEKSVWVLFEDSAFDSNSIIDDYASIIADISEKMSISVNGIINNFEIGEIKFVNEGNSLKVDKYSESGKEFDIIYDLCIRIRVSNDEELELLNEAVSSIKYTSDCIAVKRKWDVYFSQKEKDSVKYTKYNYIILNDEDYDGDYIGSLNISQIENLWVDFLCNYHTAFEFEILYDRFVSGSIMHGIFAWELALRSALSTLHIKVEKSKRDFKIIDKDGKRRYYNFESFSAAEKILLKILFPVKNEVK
ncbi:hypothetical protein [Clostridium sp. BJN0001]|uniref:hypothetical protein n=1 Tax=Clostridium sp. BJN0001 TaxID=2930219 RepID=UPI001FD2864A|nr:hypothetical protein [Clostridium sp. BJN0001]